MKYIKMRYSSKHGDRIFVKGYVFLSLAKNICKIISDKVSCKYSKKSLDHAKWICDKWT